MPSSPSGQTTQPETPVNQIICSTANEELFESSPLISSDVLLLNVSIHFHLIVVSLM